MTNTVTNLWKDVGQGGHKLMGRSCMCEGMHRRESSTQRNPVSKNTEAGQITVFWKNFFG